MDSLAEIQQAVRIKRVEFQKHSLKRIFEENLTIEKVLHILLTGEIIKDYALDKPYPSFFVLGYDGDRPIHVVCAYNRPENMLYIITNYEVKMEYYESDYKTRRKKI